jgi:hypothetical protein
LKRATARLNLQQEEANAGTVQIPSPRLVRNCKSRQRLREPLLTGFELFSDVSLLADFTPRKAPDHARKPLEHFRPTKLGSSESQFASGLRQVEARVLEEDSRPVTVGFEQVDHLRIDMIGPADHEYASRLGGSHSGTWQRTTFPSKPAVGFGGTRNVWC